jgi:hypothetical protein
MGVIVIKIIKLLIVSVLLIFISPGKTEAYNTQTTIYDGPPIAVTVPQRLNESVSVVITAPDGQKFFTSVNNESSFFETTDNHLLTTRLTLGEDVIRVAASTRKGISVEVTNMKIVQYYTMQDVPSIELTSFSMTNSVRIDYSFSSYTDIIYAGWIQEYYKDEVDENIIRSYGNETTKNINGTTYSKSGFITVTENGVYSFLAKSGEGYITVEDIEINSIDGNAPIITVTDTGSGKTKNPISINIGITDASPITTKKWDYGSKSITYFGTSGILFSGNQIEITQNGTYTVYASDSSGNKSVKTFSVTRITTPEANPPIINVNVTTNSSYPNKQMDINYEILDESLLVSKKIGIGIRNISYFQQNGVSIGEIGNKSVLTNGYYTFYAKDDYGNEAIKTVLIEGLNEMEVSNNNYIQMVGTFGNDDKAVHFHGELTDTEVNVYILNEWLDYEGYLYNFQENDPRIHMLNISEETLGLMYYDHFEYITLPGRYTAIVVENGVAHFKYLDSIDQFPIYDTLEDEIIIENNGSIIESESHSTIVNIKNRGYANTMYSQYQWTNSYLSSSTSPYNWADFISGDNIQNSGVSGDYYLHITTMDEEGNEKTIVSNKFVFKEVVESQLFDLGDIDFGIISLTPGSEQKVKAKSSSNKIEYVQDITNEQNYQITMTVAPFLSASGSQIDANNFKMLKAQSINSMGAEITGSFEFQNNTPVTMVASNSGGFYDPTHLIINNEDIELTIPASFTPNAIGNEVLTSSITYSVITIP